MAFQALKPCRFGRAYAIGETIPADAVDPSMVKKLKLIGVIGEIPDPATEPAETQEGGTEQPDDPKSAAGEPGDEDADPAEEQTEPAKRGRRPKDKQVIS